MTNVVMYCAASVDGQVYISMIVILEIDYINADSTNRCLFKTALFETIFNRN